MIWISTSVCEVTIHQGKAKELIAMTVEVIWIATSLRGHSSRDGERVDLGRQISAKSPLVQKTKELTSWTSGATSGNGSDLDQHIGLRGHSSSRDGDEVDYRGQKDGISDGVMLSIEHQRTDDR
jgi:hypothetical protein